uniref:uncharacterized protein LOC114678451 n=1 Tax=Macaca mulatta TaxID=9544 RepID=UPI0010A27075|nr:uncharacterized protein LOC114678451 [Macaca mulatta]
MGPGRGGGSVLPAALPAGRGSSARPHRLFTHPAVRVRLLAPLQRSSRRFLFFGRPGARPAGLRVPAGSGRQAAGGSRHARQGVPAASELAWGCRPPPAGPSGSSGTAGLIGEVGGASSGPRRRVPCGFRGPSPALESSMSFRGKGCGTASACQRIGPTDSL